MEQLGDEKNHEVEPAEGADLDSVIKLLGALELLQERGMEKLNYLVELRSLLPMNHLI